MAAHEGKVDVVRLLTEAKAHVNIQTKVHTLCHILSNVDCHVLSDDMGESMYTECCVHACTQCTCALYMLAFVAIKCSNNVLLLV